MRTVKNILLGAAAVLIFAAHGTLAQTASDIHLEQQFAQQYESVGN